MWRKKVFRSANLTKATKTRVFRTMVMSVLLYRAETWSSPQKDLRKLKTFHMKYLQDILGVTRWDKIRNESLSSSVNEVPIEVRTCTTEAPQTQVAGTCNEDGYSCRVQCQLLCSKLTGKVIGRKTAYMD